MGEKVTTATVNKCFVVSFLSLFPTLFLSLLFVMDGVLLVLPSGQGELFTLV